MRVHFGWLSDGAAWRDDAESPVVCVGRVGLVSLLRTRVGLGRPQADASTRIAQYRDLLHTADHPWYCASLARDPWNTAAQVLDLRDRAVSMGWTPREPISQRPELDSSATPARIAALIEVETTRGQTTVDVGPGLGDDLHELLTELSEVEWPLGIDQIRLDQAVDALPHPWPRLFGLLKDSGVALVEPDSETEEPLPEITVVRGDDEWQAAESAARFLCTVPDLSTVTIIAGDSTEVLDQALHRRGLPMIGSDGGSSSHPSAQLLPLLVSAVLPPFDAHRVVELLTFPFIAKDVDADQDAHLTGLLPLPVRGALLDALVKEPGISSDADSAWMRALAHLRGRIGDSAATRAEADWELASVLDGYLRTEPLKVSGDHHVRIAEVRDLLDWAGRRVRALGGGAPSRFVEAAGAHISSTSTVLDLLTGHTLLIRELYDIIDACSPSVSTADAHAAPWSVVTDPAHVPPDAQTVLWWSCHAAPPAPAHEWDEDEVQALESGGALITTAAHLERLRQSAVLTGLRSATTLFGFLPESVAGAQHRLHPALVQLIDQTEVTATTQKALEVHTVT